MKKQVRVAVFPVAGRGTRFLPATKSSPKEMLPVVDKPLIQYAVEEAIEAGATRLVFVTGASKRAIEDHFDKDSELERALEKPGKEALLASVQDIVPKGVSCIYIRQGEPLGLGHAILCAQPAVGDNPFFVHLADDLIHGEVPCLQEMADYRAAHDCSVLGVETVPKEQTASYGIVDIGDASMKTGGRIRFMVEKPQPENAPSNLGVVGRYLLEPVVFEKLANTGTGAGGEIQLTDGIAAMLDEHPVHAMPFSGVRYDCGSKLGYLKANVELALAHPELGTGFSEYLKSRS